MERDNDTFKNLCVVPVTTSRLIAAKLSVVLIYGLFYTLCNTGFMIFFTWILKAGTIYDVGFKLVFSLVFGIEITVATLPIIVFIIYFNKSYLISTLFSFFYAILNWSVVSLVEVNLSLVKVINLFPTLCVMNWSSKKNDGTFGGQTSFRSSLFIISFRYLGICCTGDNAGSFDITHAAFL